MAQKTRFFVSDVQPSILMSQAENKRAFDTMGNYFANRDLTDTFREENG